MEIGAKMVKIVCLDAGHGYVNGRYSGAGTLLIKEDDFAFDMVTRIKHHIALLSDDKVAVVLSRKDANLVGINKRAEIAVQTGCDFFLSIHANAAGSKSANGVEAYVAEDDHRSLDIAKKLIGVIGKLVPRVPSVRWDSQSQHSKLGVLRGTYKHMPAILLELGFLTNTKDALNMGNKYVKEQWAQSIAKAIVDQLV